MKPRVAILTSLTDYAPSYSLVGIILDQARSLARNGYEYDLLCLKNFNADHRDRLQREEGLNVRYELPQTRLVDYKTGEGPRGTTDKELGFEQQVLGHLNGDPGKGTTGYQQILDPYDVVITHDLMFLSWHLPQNAAIRKCIERWPDKNWLHWIHSAPSQRPGDTVYPSTLRFEAAPHSTYVFLNDSQKHECALMLGTTRDRVATVYNPKDVRDVYDFSRETRAMIAAYNLFEHDLMQVYPFSTPRWTVKGVKQLVKLAMNWRQQGVKSKLVLVNANCNSAKDKKFLSELERYIQDSDLQLDHDVILTSRFAKQAKLDEWLYCVPQRVIRELVQMSNLFVFPSPLECCSLIQAEAAIAGKFMVLNRDCEPIMEFGGSKCLHFRFTLNDPDIKETRQYYTDVAREIWAEIQTETAVMVATRARNQTYNRDWIFRTQIEPLLLKGFSRTLKRTAGLDLPQTQPTAFPTKNPCTAGPAVSKPGLVLKEVIAKELSVGKVDYSDPRPGDTCPVFGECSGGQRVECYAQAGHCPVLDEEV